MRDLRRKASLVLLASGEERNPLVAEPLFLARYIEKAGTGTLDIIERLRLAGLPEPKFLQEGGTFINRLWRRDRAAEPIGDIGGRSSQARVEARVGVRVVAGPSFLAHGMGPEVRPRPDHVRPPRAAHPFVNEKFCGACSYRRIAGYFRSSINETRSAFALD